jgi:glutathione S-transferase
MRPLFTASGQSRKRWDRAAIDRGRAEVETALGYIEHYLGDGGYAVGERLTWADGALLPQLYLAYEWAPVLFDAPSPLGQHPKLAAYWAGIKRDPIAARLLRETREAVAHEQENARAIARQRAAAAGTA